MCILHTRLFFFNFTTFPFMYDDDDDDFLKNINITLFTMRIIIN
jgi:hypothetical protein